MYACYRHITGAVTVLIAVISQEQYLYAFCRHITGAVPLHLLPSYCRSSTCTLVAVISQRAGPRKMKGLNFLGAVPSSETYHIHI